MADLEVHERLLDKDWGEKWDQLPEAPDLVYRRPKAAQITLRVPAGTLGALRRVARSKSLPYHALARSWIVDGLRAGELPTAADQIEDAETVRSAEQLNLKVEPELLDELKRFSDGARRSYHQLARQWVRSSLKRELSGPASLPRLSLRELMLLLLDGDGADHDAVRGRTRLQKLLFVIQQELDQGSSTFYAYNYGPFDEKVIDSAEALRANGFLTGDPGDAALASPPTFDQMMAVVSRRAGPRGGREPEVFQLSAAGRQRARRLRQSSPEYERLHARVQALRQEWDQGDLLERVYERFPEMTQKSLIKAEVASRRRHRGT